MIAPCKDCKERRFKCHSECEKYKQYVDERKELIAKRKQDAEFVCYLINKQAQKERALKRHKGQRRKVH